MAKQRLMSRDAPSGFGSTNLREAVLAYMKAEHSWSWTASFHVPAYLVLPVQS